MEDINKIIEYAIQDVIREGVKQRLTRDYQNPIDGLISAAITSQADSISLLVRTSIESCMSDESFRADIASSVRTVLAKTLVQKFGGELEKQVNTLKSDPATRARITLAIEQIVKEKVS